MRVFVAGATGVIGIRLVPLLVQAGHEVIGMTRTPAKVEALQRLGAEAVVCDVYDARALRDAVVAAAPDVVVHELTDLPDDVARLDDFGDANVRIRTEGTRNLLDAAGAAGAKRFLAQSIALELPGRRGEAVAELEHMVTAYGGVAIRYGQFYGPGTYHEDEPPDPPRIHIDEAARRTAGLLEAAPGVVTVVED
jgi:nucleoside-diphosphate-sugar epimerase